jgi:UMF1 family MFS transporter
MDRVSAWGFAFGYLGGALALILFLLVVNFGSTIGAADGVAQLRIGVAIIGLWWGLFTIPTILILRDRGVSRAAGQSTVQIARGAMVEVARTVRHIRRYRMLLIFLVGYLFINDGVQTVISQSSTFAVQELKFSALEATMLVLVFQFICLLGAMGVDPIIRRVGRKTTMIGYLLVWVVLLVAAVLVQTKTQLWILSVPLGLVIGGTQSVARSMMGLMTPPKRTAEFFGFFNFSGKATSWMGNFVFAAAIFTTGNFRLAIASLLVFFVIGCAFIYFVDVSRGQREALAEES